ncbi:Retrovirus-related Pol polyprotein from transposon TNT 1-94 [Dendrobium catenatum]|uniref:Retrovirus-related Pol polyprotein from transposon TNT 1-94 n=1 Tax=Dendrobium catenatum TaxID=906689 RepID=A0A2I0WVF9_9ASPA|nr:Retrovirus-related Pol polyprotein from transposon TNT 1-94 [Dendrobium catenatum]
MATSSTSAASDNRQGSGNPQETAITHHQLKFLMNHIKGLSLTLNAENFPIWRSQIFKLFKANGFEGFLDGSCPCPNPSTILSETEMSFKTWNHIDQNLAAALYSVISPSILPYVLSLDHCTEIWDTIARRLQSNTRSRTIQLRNELHHLSMKNQTMPQYLIAVKSIVDAITATGSPLDPEEVIFYTLNGLPVQYQYFKTAIRTNLQPLSLDDLYTLLCSEELNIAQETTSALQIFNSPILLPLWRLTVDEGVQEPNLADQEPQIEVAVTRIKLPPATSLARYVPNLGTPPLSVGIVMTLRTHKTRPKRHYSHHPTPTAIRRTGFLIVGLPTTSRPTSQTFKQDDSITVINKSLLEMDISS